MKATKSSFIMLITTAALLLACAMGWFAHQEQQRSARLLATLAEMRTLETKANTSFKRLEALADFSRQKKPVAFDLLVRTYWDAPGVEAESGEQAPFEEGWVTHKARLGLTRVPPADLLVFVRTAGRQEPPWVLSRVILAAEEGQTISGELTFEMLLPEMMHAEEGEER